MKSWAASEASRPGATKPGRPVECQAKNRGCLPGFWSDFVIVEARSFAGEKDTRAIQELASRLWPLGWHPGGLGWALARGRLADEVVVFDGPDGVAGWAARGGHHPGELLAQADPAHSGAATAVVEWLLATATAAELSIEVADDDRGLLATLRRAGFVPGGGESAVIGMRRPARAEPHAPPAGPMGFAFRPVRPHEIEARVEVHRAAWLPASLPYPTQHRPLVEPGATSSFTESSYQAIRRTWLYNPELDLVAVGPDSRMAACCIAWLDPSSGVAEIEPLGVVPERRGRGLAVALCLEVASRVGALGGTGLFINGGPSEEYPAPARAYAKAGFEVFGRASTYVLRRAVA